MSQELKTIPPPCNNCEHGYLLHDEETKNCEMPNCGCRKYKRTR